MLKENASRIKKHINNNKKFYTGVSALATAAALDIGLTSTNINKYGTGIEGNPFLRDAIEYWGINIGLTGTKTLSTFAIAGIAKEYYNRYEEIKGNLCLYAGASTWSIAAASHLSIIINPSSVTLFN
jgi:hypothetical protein